MSPAMRLHSRAPLPYKLFQRNDFMRCTNFIRINVSRTILQRSIDADPHYSAITIGLGLAMVPIFNAVFACSRDTPVSFSPCIFYRK